MYAEKLKHRLTEKNTLTHQEETPSHQPVENTQNTTQLLQVIKKKNAKSKSRNYLQTFRK